jgi:PadR family transcriptional regulator PadR
MIHNTEQPAGFTMNSWLHRPRKAAKRKVHVLNETDTVNKKFQKELNSGTVALVLLSVLSRTSEPMYGYQIAKQIGVSGEDIPMMKQGALYPVLRSLENGGLLKSQVEPSVSGPPRRYYRITEVGDHTLVRWTEIWSKTRTFVDNILKGSSHA